jgi:biopolymer transport protein ExbD
MKIHTDLPSEETRIELVPLIDVIFCILTFFLLAALQLTRQQAINVDLPKARTGESQMREMMIVSIDNFGQTYVDQLPVNDNQLERILRTYRTKDPNGLMVLYAPKEARYARVVEVLDRLREVGGDRVALATLPASTPSPVATPSLQFNPGNLPPTNNPANSFPRQIPTPSLQFNPGNLPPTNNPANSFSSPIPSQIPSPIPTQIQPGTNSNPNQPIQSPPASPAVKPEE